MAPVQKFRSALNGFNREDVVHYIELLNNQHTAQIEQLTNQLSAALAQADNTALLQQLDSANARIQELESALAASSAASDTELEIYRRAERTERQAQNRARQIYDQTNAVLAEASLKAEDVSARIAETADLLAQQLEQYRQVILSSKDTFQESAAALTSICPEA